jgi:hypothetical protein
MALLHARENNSEFIIKSTVLIWWKKELSLSVYDFKNYASVATNQVDRRPPRCPLAQGYPKRRAQFYFALSFHCDVTQNRIKEYRVIIKEIDTFKVM